MNKTTNNQEKKELNIFLFLFLGFIILQHLGKIILNLMNLLQPQNEYFFIDKNVYLYSIVLSIAMIVVIIGTMGKKKWGVIGFFCLQIANLIGIQALSEEHQDLSFQFLVTCVICAIFALLLCLRSKGESAWKIIFEQKESMPRKNYLFALRNVHWFKKENKEMKSSNEDSKAKENISSDASLTSEEKVTNPSDESKASDKRNKKHFMKVLLIAFSAIVIVSASIGSYFLYKHYTDNEYLMNKANETFKNGDINKALEMYEELADKKDFVPAKSRLGYLYLENDSVPLDFKKGLPYLESVAINDSDALNNLMSIYLGRKCKGQDFTNLDKAKYYAELALNKGIILADAYFVLGNVASEKNDNATAFYYWEKSSQYNKQEALDNLGWMTYNGNGCKIDYAKAYGYFKKALEINSEDEYAMYYLGLFYLYGDVVKQDKYEARSLFKRAADLGNEDAAKEYSKLQMSLPNKGLLSGSVYR